MNQLITGLHHVTAMASNAQKNVDFYAGILGLRMVKKTINFDAPDVYHLYYGNEDGSPGTIMTFFPFPGIAKGRKGKGQLTATSFSIPENSLSYWMQRLEKFKIAFEAPQERFETESFIYFEDADGLGIELIANKSDERKGFTYGQIPDEHAVKGFYSVTLAEEGYERTAGLLTEQMDHKLIAEKGNRFRFSASAKPGDLVDVICSPDSLRGLGGGGTVHHVAFATPTDESQLTFREKVNSKGTVNTTPVLDRQYFHSIYFREPGGVLFEVATNPPGFAIDEPKEHLGELLKLPPWEEANRNQIEKLLPPIKVDIEKFRD
jgi:glyoxalase family protein